MFGEGRNEIGVIGRIGREGGAIAQRALDVVALNGDIQNLVALYLANEIREGELLFGALSARTLKQVEQRHDQQGDDDPQRNISAEIVQRPSPIN